ncbi:leucine-rich repeat-containing protein 23 [Halyomorpha halys]|uniref:leucine-rich repeat-containing protein 23 n=1 Tax=Halyomorpha halys TaxID=286706 RepID=UPI0006D4C937
MDQFDLEDDLSENEKVAEIYHELEKALNSQHEAVKAAEEEGTEEGMGENSDETETAHSAEHVNIEEEAMYIRDGNLLWPRVEFKDREKIPRTRISFVPADRFNHYGWHHLLNTYVPFGCDLSKMQLLSLQGIDFLWFLTYVDASENLLRTHTLGQLVHLRGLIALKVDNNQLDNIMLPHTLTELMYLDVAYNAIEKIPARELPNLLTLRLDANKIKKITNLTKRYFPKLKFLSMSINQISSLRFPWSNNLVYLYLGYNNIRSLEGLDGLYKLRVLHLRGNLIMSINHLTTDLICLEYLNLRDNKIADLRCIEYLTRFEYLSELIVTGNPFTLHPVTRSTYKAIIIKWLPQLTRLNKQDISEGMRAEAEHPDVFGGEEADEFLGRSIDFGEGGEELDSDDASVVMPPAEKEKTKTERPKQTSKVGFNK